MFHTLNLLTGGALEIRAPDFAPLSPTWEFPKIGVPYSGVLIIRILLFIGYYIRVPYFRKLPVYKGM